MVRRRRLLTWDSAAALDGGSVVCSQLSALTYSYNKEPAGHIYHIKALKQAGLYGKLYLVNNLLTFNLFSRCVSIMPNCI